MQGKTHFVVGIASALAICRPQTFPLLIAGTGCAAIGSVISDIDIGNSSAQHDADKIIAVIIGIIGSIVLADLNLKLGIYNRLLSETSRPRQLSVITIFIMICAFGKSTGHRSFMHSLLSMLLLSLCVYLLLPSLTAYFAIAYGTHLLLDLLNKKKERLFWPSKKGYGLAICSSKGLFNRIFFLIGLVASITLFMTSRPMLTTGNMISSYLSSIYNIIHSICLEIIAFIKNLF